MKPLTYQEIFILYIIGKLKRILRNIKYQTIVCYMEI